MSGISHQHILLCEGSLGAEQAAPCHHAITRAKDLGEGGGGGGGGGGSSAAAQQIRLLPTHTHAHAPLRIFLPISSGT